MEVGKINRFGVLVMTRQRLRPSLQQVSHEELPHLPGHGQGQEHRGPGASAWCAGSRPSSAGTPSPRSGSSWHARHRPGRAQPEAQGTDQNWKRRLRDSSIVILADAGDPLRRDGGRDRTRRGRARLPRRPVGPGRARTAHRGHRGRNGGAGRRLRRSRSRRPWARRACRSAPAPKPAPAVARESTECRDTSTSAGMPRSAALDERERLRALFESAKPEAEDGDPRGGTRPPRPSTSRRSRGRPVRQPAPAVAAGTTVETPLAPKPEPEVKAVEVKVVQVEAAPAAPVVMPVLPMWPAVMPPLPVVAKKLGAGSRDRRAPA